MGIKEDRYVEFFYEKYKGRIAIGVGYAQDMAEIFPFVFEAGATPLGIIAMTTLSRANTNSVHIFHLSAFKPGHGNGSTMLKRLCLEADKLEVALSLSPIPSPNGEAAQITSSQLRDWYRKFGFTGDSLMHRPPSFPGGCNI